MEELMLYGFRSFFLVALLAIAFMSLPVFAGPPLGEVRFAVVAAIPIICPTVFAADHQHDAPDMVMIALVQSCEASWEEVDGITLQGQAVLTVIAYTQATKPGGGPMATVMPTSLVALQSSGEIETPLRAASEPSWLQYDDRHVAHGDINGADADDDGAIWLQYDTQRSGAIADFTRGHGPALLSG